MRFIAILCISMFVSCGLAQEACQPWLPPPTTGEQHSVETLEGTQVEPNFAPVIGDEKSPELIFLGDSLTRDGSGLFPKAVANRLGKSMAVYAIGGQTSSVLAELFDLITVPNESTGIIWIGRNNAPDDLQILNDIESSVQRFKNNRYIVLGYLSGRYASEQPNQNRRILIDNSNDLLEKRYGRNFVNPRDFLDCDDFRDNIHLTSLGYEKVGSAVSLRLIELEK